MREREFAKRLAEMERGEAAGFKEHADCDGRPTYQALSTMYERVGRDTCRPQVRWDWI